MELGNIKETKNIIEEVDIGSIAAELGIEKGDIILSINGKEIKDIIDYKYLVSDDYILLQIQRAEEIWEFEIEKDFDEDLGIIFTNPLIDKAKSCKNKCIFCFVDQLPPNMRETLYFKDDDSRLSFLQGNFITLTNMTDDEIDRIIEYRLSPINVSVHTTNPDLRVKMLKNKNAGKVYSILKRFHKANLEVNCQIVLVPEVNDGEELDRTLRDLSKLYPSVSSVAVVPIGITKYRENLEKVKSFDANMSSNLLKYFSEIQNKFLVELGTQFVFPSDEFFALSHKELPSYEEYEGFPQLENGVGLMKLFQYEVEEELKNTPDGHNIDKTFTIATGTLAYDFMKDIAERIEKKFKGLEIKVVPIKNNFFGEKITVSGLITGGDLIQGLKGIITDKIIIPKSMMKSGEDIFLDNITLKDLEKKIGVPVMISKVSGKQFIDLFRGEVKK
ncbi:DUF512 domain-containing protein [Tissierella creatinophila]|uniref:PDZ domain-containing protein n=1 Tax=Tissierella creatinophila DSM 6911 TaxID=1123403 RepID=A0A1U7M2Y9_TISCR|nr:DUF512 domain-containing protein [Tissierella creatinophila]OLS01684.1 hypothetical protein TICRE_22840 [Tissierella creatinophila DSM 6911]